jgi:hypothetical protein
VPQNMEHAMGQMDGGQWVILVQRATLTVQLLHIKGGLHCRTDATQLHEGACSSSPLVAEPEGSAPLILELPTGHDPEPAPILTAHFPKIHHTNELTLVAEPEGSTPLVPRRATGHDPEPVQSTSHPHSPCP